MPAVVGPVGIENADFGDCGVPVFLVPEVVSNEKEVLECHRQRQRLIEVFKRIVRFGNEMVKSLDVGGLGIVLRQALRLFFGGLPGIDRVDAVGLDGGKFGIGDFPVDHIGRGRTDDRLLIFLQKLHALNGGIRPLVELAGQKLDREDTAGMGKSLFIDVIDRRL